jgi:hypothetical protein
VSVVLRGRLAWTRGDGANYNHDHFRTSTDASMLVYEPRIDIQNARARASPRTLNGMTGKVIGFIDNAKPNFNHLVDDLAEVLVEKYGAAAVRKYRKQGPNIPASAAVIQELRDQSDLVITGSAE